MKQYLIFLSIVTIMLSSCKKEIPMDFPENERKLVLNGIFFVGQPVMLSVSKSKSLLEKSKIEDVQNAEIKLFEDSVYITDLDTISRLWRVNYIYDQNSNGSYDPFMDSVFRTTYYSKDLLVTPGKLYKIEASAQGIDKKAYVEFKAPSMVPIVAIDTATIKTNQWSESLQFELTIDDPPNEANFYLVYLNAVTFAAYLDEFGIPRQQRYSFMAQIETNDLIISNDNIYLENGLCFNDDLFNGRLMKFNFNTPLMFGDSTNFQVQLQSISEDYYNYIASSSLFRANDGNPIAEPVSVKSNVKDGFGAVAIVNRWIDSSIIYVRPGNMYPGKVK